MCSENIIEKKMKLKALIILICCLANSAYSMGVLNKKCNFDAIIFDIGSGASKSYRYNVDLCNHELKLGVTDSKVYHVQYQECISNSDVPGEIPKSCLITGEKSVKDFMRYYEMNCKRNVCLGVATAWARNAKNADEVIKMYKKHGIEIEIVDQGQEGILSFEAAVNVLSEKEKKKALVLDLGGGSHQISYYDKYGNIEIFLGDLGNSNFYKSVIEHFGEDKLYSNLDGYFNVEILEDVLKYAKMRMGDKLGEGINIEYDAIYGLGRSIYNYLTANLGLGPDKVSKAKLKEMIYEMSQYSQAEAVDKFNLSAHSFAPYMQVSLIILYTILDGLGLDELNLLSVRMTDSILLQYLEDRSMRRGYN